MATAFFRLVFVFGAFSSLNVAWAQTLVPRPDPKFAESSQPSTRRWALIIGVGQYAREPEVRYAINDVQLIESALISSGDFHRDQMLTLSDSQPPSFQPTLDNLNQQIPRWLSNAGPDDSVFVYFSGHGVSDSAGNGVLCPSGFDQSSSQSTGLPLAQLRRWISDCNAKQKLLVLDCCHAGTARAIGVRPKVDTNKLLTEFQGVTGLVTLASCGANELSFEDDQRRQGVFTSHVAQAIRGAADVNLDGLVDSEELFDWCSKRVPPLVQKKFNADQHPVRLRQSKEVIGIIRTQFAPSVDFLVDRKDPGVFRVQFHGQGERTVLGSAFAIAYVKGKLFLVTAASVVEDEDGRQRAKERIRLEGRLYTPEAHVTRILTHRERRNGSGPDVAILELTWNTSINPTMFNLKLPDDQISLNNRGCAFLAFPNRQAAGTVVQAEYGPGSLVGAYEGQYRYRTSYPYQADGAPLFVIDDQSERGSQLRETVVAITTNNRYGDDQRLAEPVERVWEIIADNTQSLGYSILPLPRRSRAALKENETSLTVPDRGSLVQEPAPPVNPQEQIERALKLAVVDGRNQNWNRAIAHLMEIESQLAAQGLSATLPWEFYSLRGVLHTHRAFDENENNNRSAAIRSFSAAWKDCHHGWEMAPNELYAMLMLARVYNNLGTPSPGAAISAQELGYLKWTHDKMQALVTDDDKGVRKLEPRDMAQCQYLLGYVHEIAGTQICSTANGRDNFLRSWAKLHSNQAAQMMQSQAPNGVDLWNEFDQLLMVWERRRSTVCIKCQTPQACPTCR